MRYGDEDTDCFFTQIERENIRRSQGADVLLCFEWPPLGRKRVSEKERLHQGWKKEREKIR